MNFRMMLLISLFVFSTSAFAIEVEGQFSLKARVKDLIDQNIPQAFFEKMTHTKQPRGAEFDDLPFPLWGASAVESLDSLIDYLDINKNDSDRISLSAQSFFRFSQPLSNLVIENIQWTFRQNGIQDLDRPYDPDQDLGDIFEAAVGSTKAREREILLTSLCLKAILEAVEELKNQISKSTCKL
jgi:hypothetical protein